MLNDAKRLILPVDNYTTGDYRAFGATIRRHVLLWATHLGDDVAVPAGTPVRAIGPGKVVLAKTLPGSEDHRSWGGLVVLKHDLNDQGPMTNNQSNPKPQLPGIFYSLYGHLKGLRVKAGEHVEQGQPLGVVAEGPTPENGWWKNAHLHFGIYTGPWNGRVLPGYWRPEQFWRTKKKWWHNPRAFIQKHAN